MPHKFLQHLRTIAACVCVCTLPACAQMPSAAAHDFRVSGRTFLLDGKPFQVISGELHYTRVPREYWRDRLRKAKAMGLNSITTYAFWNVHEPQPGTYDFSGQNDIAEFLREAQEEGLYVVLRPGPYVCAEWELGGYPAWLLKDRSLVLRSNDPKYVAAVDTWLKRLAEEVKPLLLANGGPILAVQLENEYNAFGNDKDYLERLKQTYQRVGFGNGVLFTSNQAGDLAKVSMPELPAAVNFGSGGASQAVQALEAYRPDGVRMVGEYWAGWFDKWGEEHHVTDAQKEADELDFMLRQGFSVSLYMFHGGTNFGWMNGADSHTGLDYHPDTTSYDYDAPLDESGNPGRKYALFQKVISSYLQAPRAAMPTPTRRTAYQISPVGRSASLWLNLPAPVESDLPLSFEDLRQNYGYVLYRKNLAPGEGGELAIEKVHDYAQVYLDHHLIGTLDRRLDQHTVEIPKQAHASTLDILVENTGRVNYSHAIRTEQTGLIGTVTLAKQTMRRWKMFSLPMSDLSNLHFTRGKCIGPCFYQASMSVDEPADTYLETSGLAKGQLWVSTHNLGRFWSIGPQHTLFTPAPWLTTGKTTLTWFDLAGTSSETLRSVSSSDLGTVTHEREKQ